MNIRNEGFDVSPFGLPDTAGVYAIVRINQDTKDEEIMYIGSSLNMRRRVYNPKHHYRQLFDNKSENEVVCAFYLETSNYESLEIELIKKYNPQLNVIHNG